MATSHVSLSTVASGTRTNTTITAPASLANDDILRIYFSIGAEPGPVPTATPPTGFTQLLFSSQSGLGGSGAGVLDLYVWEKRAASESGNYTITHNSTFTAAYMEVVRGGVTSGSAEDFAATINQQVDNSTYTALGGTTTVNDSFVTFAFITWEDASPVTPPTGTTPTFTERYDPATGELYVANGVLATAGATGNKSATGNTQATFGGSNTTLTSVKAAVAAAGGWGRLLSDSRNRMVA